LKGTKADGSNTKFDDKVSAAKTDYLFTTGDLSKWLFTDRDAVLNASECAMLDLCQYTAGTDLDAGTRDNYSVLSCAKACHKDNTCTSWTMTELIEGTCSLKKTLPSDKTKANFKVLNPNLDKRTYMNVYSSPNCKKGKLDDD
jgi:hypothetical protein